MKNPKNNEKYSWKSTKTVRISCARQANHSLSRKKQSLGRSCLLLVATREGLHNRTMNSIPLYLLQKERMEWTQAIRRNSSPFIPTICFSGEEICGVWDPEKCGFECNSCYRMGWYLPQVGKFHERNFLWQFLPFILFRYNIGESFSCKRRYNLPTTTTKSPISTISRNWFVRATKKIQWQPLGEQSEMIWTRSNVIWLFFDLLQWDKLLVYEIRERATPGRRFGRVRYSRYHNEEHYSWYTFKISFDCKKKWCS